MKTFVFRSAYLHSFGAASSSYSSYSKTVFRLSPFILFHSSSLSSSSSSHSSTWWHHNKESEIVRVLVWWDFDTCSPPVGVNVLHIPQRITAALRLYGMKGQVTITAYGDVFELTRVNREALASVGILQFYVPSINGKCRAYNHLLHELFLWISKLPPPTHIFLISGNRGFANILHRLWRQNYNILLACTDYSSGVLCSAASIMWHWGRLDRGDSFLGKHFNHPPDGIHGSWYGHCKGPLDDPFIDAEQSTCTQIEEHHPSSESLQLNDFSQLNPNALGSINDKFKSSTNEPKDHTLTTESNAVFSSSSTHQATKTQGHKERKTSKIDSIPLQQHDSTGEDGFFRRIWRTWFGHKTRDCNEKKM